MLAESCVAQRDSHLKLMVLYQTLLVRHFLSWHPTVLIILCPVWELVSVHTLSLLLLLLSYHLSYITFFFEPFAKCMPFKWSDVFDNLVHVKLLKE